MSPGASFNASGLYFLEMKLRFLIFHMLKIVSLVGSNSGLQLIGRY